MFLVHGRLPRIYGKQPRIPVNRLREISMIVQGSLFLFWCNYMQIRVNINSSEPSLGDLWEASGRPLGNLRESPLHQNIVSPELEDASRTVLLLDPSTMCMCVHRTPFIVNVLTARTSVLLGIWSAFLRLRPALAQHLIAEVPSLATHPFPQLLNVEIGRHKRFAYRHAGSVL